MNTQVIVLHVDPRPEGARWRRELLRAGLAVNACQADQRVLLRVLRGSCQEVGVLLVDLKALDTDAAALVQLLEGICGELRPELHVIVEPGDDRACLLAEGVDGTVERDAPLPLLVARLRAACRRATRLLAIHTRYRRLELESLLDSPSKLYNLRALRLRLLEELDRADREGRPLSLMMLQVHDMIADLDVSQMMLSKLTTKLKVMLRPYDVIFKIAPARLVLLLTDRELLVASTMARRLLNSLDGAALTDPGDESSWVRLRLTVALAGVDAHDKAVSSSELLNALDQGLSRATVGQLEICHLPGAQQRLGRSQPPIVAEETKHCDIVVVRHKPRE